jgi:UDP-N-acetylmuramate--alanine ligase
MRIHFVGIGGIGVSALAQYYLAKGHKVSGSDLVASEITEFLRKKGIKILIGKENLQSLSKKFDLIIHSPAVNIRHPASNILSYPQALGELTKQYFTIAVSGTHGKSTTTAMLGLLLQKASLDPTVIVGTKLKEFGNSNCRIGKSKYLVIEADEYAASFLNYWPKIIVLTNIEADHLDYYKNYRNVLKAFRKFIGHLPKEGVLIQNSKFKIQNKNSKFKIINYRLGQAETEKLRKILKVPGKHNISNALAVLLAARELKIPDRISFMALSEYKGCWRRFEELKIKKQPSGESPLGPGKFKIISDYGHHPTEISATLKAARGKWPRKEIWCIFQPHQYQRTYYLFKDFLKAIKNAPVDKFIITDIYDVAGREEKKIKKEVSAEKLVKAINRKKIIYLPTGKIADFVKNNLPKNGVLIIMGAGDIYKLANFFHKARVDSNQK